MLFVKMLQCVLKTHCLHHFSILNSLRKTLRIDYRSAISNSLFPCHFLLYIDAEKGMFNFFNFFNLGASIKTQLWNIIRNLVKRVSGKIMVFSRLQKKEKEREKKKRGRRGRRGWGCGRGEGRGKGRRRHGCHHPFPFYLEHRCYGWSCVSLHLTLSSSWITAHPASDNEANMSIFTKNSNSIVHPWINPEEH